MFRNSLWFFVLLSVPAAAWAGPASRPTLKSATRVSEPESRPSIDLADLQRELDAALRHVSRVRFEAGDRFDVTPAGKSAAAEVAARRKALEKARAFGPARERLEASSAYNKARAARESARDNAIASDSQLLLALTAADRAKTDLDRGKAALGMSDVVKPRPPPVPPATAIRPEYKVESGKSVAGMRAINITFTVVSDAQQVESVLRSELMSDIDKDPPGGNVVIYALDDNGNKLTTPDGSAGMVFVLADHQIVTLKTWTAHRR